MARDTQIVEGIYLAKATGTPRRVYIPEQPAQRAKIVNGGFVGVMQVGECVVICSIGDVTQEGMPLEMREKFEAAIAAWHERQGEEQKRQEEASPASKRAAGSPGWGR